MNPIILGAIMVVGAIAVIAFIVWLVLRAGSTPERAGLWLRVAAGAGIVCGALGAVGPFLPN